MEVKDLIRVFVKGGIISAGHFLQVLLAAEKLGACHICFGSRQDILLASKEKDIKILDEVFQSIRVAYEINTITHQNISSSYVALDILPGKKWLASHIYHYILDSFDYQTTLRINVVDPSQSLVPLFTGQVNFIASNQENYWYVYLRFVHIQNAPWQMPLLVYSEDLVTIAKALETHDVLNKPWTYQEVFRFITEEVNLNTQPVTEDLTLPETYFPYYEGIHKQTDETYWLGLYWRTNQYKIETLKAIMEHCIETEVGTVNLTPWKSFIIKGIKEKDRMGWEKLMGKFGMNLRHSSLELNWHIPALDQEALDLKFYLVRELDKQDISTYGLTFTIKTKKDITPFTSVVIEKSETSEPDIYNILYSKGFNPNLNEYNDYAREVHRSVLASLILELSLIYYENLEETLPKFPKAKKINDSFHKDLFQCRHCQTVYDPEYGDPEEGIKPATNFDELPDNYKCPTCGAHVADYQKVFI
ncbi:MAG: rubredoxin [Bacteroidota bacterium]